MSYSDTVVYDSTNRYEFGTYQGAKPYFINFWLPCKQTGSPNSYQDFLDYGGSEKVSELADSIYKMQLNSVLNFGVMVNLDTDETPRYGADLLEAVLKGSVKSSTSIAEKDGKFPTIIYHHGNGGVPFENSTLFEYAASHGFAVISSYYHWPNQATHSYPQALEDVEFIYSFASGLPFVDADQIHYLGHSWGGGVALQMNHRNSVNFKSYLIYDSSLEHYGLEEFAYLYREMDSLFRNHGNEFKTKTMVFSASATYLDDEGKRTTNPAPEYKPYQFFNQDLFTYYTLNNPLNHGQFTSLGVIRESYVSNYEFIDESSLISQAKNHQYLIQLTLDVLLGKPLSGNNYVEFKIE